MSCRSPKGHVLEISTRQAAAGRSVISAANISNVAKKRLQSDVRDGPSSVSELISRDELSLVRTETTILHLVCTIDLFCDQLLPSAVFHYSQMVSHLCSP